MTHAANEDGHTFDFEQVRKAELEWIARRRESVGLPPPDDDLVGLAFSGGGIRSAVFNLGVLQSLEQGGLLRQVDYLSSVSGGGYIASCHSWLKARLPTSHEGSVFSASLASGGGSVLDWLRARPLVHVDRALDFMLVHAGLAPPWRVDDAERAAREVEQRLRGVGSRGLLLSMFGNKPDRWHPRLQGMDRLRAAINVGNGMVCVAVILLSSFT